MPRSRGHVRVHAADGAGSPPRHARGGYLVALLGGLAGLAVAAFVAWLQDALTLSSETTLTTFGFWLYLVMLGPFVGVSVGAGFGLRLRGHSAAWLTAGATALLGVPAFFLTWFVLLDLPGVPFVVIPLLIALLPLPARALVHAAIRSGVRG